MYKNSKSNRGIFLSANNMLTRLEYPCLRRSKLCANYSWFPCMSHAASLASCSILSILLAIPAIAR